MRVITCIWVFTTIGSASASSIWRNLFNRNKADPGQETRGLSGNPSNYPCGPCIGTQICIPCPPEPCPPCIYEPCIPCQPVMPSAYTAELPVCGSPCVHGNQMCLCPSSAQVNYEVPARPAYVPQVKRRETKKRVVPNSPQVVQSPPNAACVPVCTSIPCVPCSSAIVLNYIQAPAGKPARHGNCQHGIRCHREKRVKRPTTTTTTKNCTTTTTVTTIDNGPKHTTSSNNCHH